MSDFHNIYFRISQRIALLIIKKCSENIYANFPPIQLLNFGASLHKIVHFTSTKRNAIEKQFIAFSGTFTVEIIFFRRLCVKKWVNEIFFRSKICVLLNEEKSISPSTLDSDAEPFFTRNAAFDTQCRFNSPKKMKFQRFFIFLKKRRIFHLVKMFYAGTKMNIWQIVTGYSDN